MQGEQMLGDTMVDLSGITLTLVAAAGEVNILRGLDLSVGRGETLSVVGPSGSGKTSMLMVMAGLEKATAGTVRIAGTDLGPLGEDELARFRRRHVGIVFQSFHLIPTMSAVENVALPLEFAGDPQAMDRAAQALRSVGLGGRVRHLPGQLSGGEQQRVAIARALVAGPDLLLADEPTGNLDRSTEGQVMDLLFERCRVQGTTLVLVTHDPGIAGRCSRTVRMEDGLLITDGVTT
jgi:putative ABC transport system ATP-binding protein